MLELRLFGNTYEIKEELKASKFRWNAEKKCWYKRFDLNEKGIGREYVKNLADAFEADGTIGCEIIEVF